MTATTMVKRSQFKTFLNTGTTTTPIWSLIGDGVTTGKISYNPQTLEEVYIHEDSATTEVERYKPAMAIDSTAKQGDAVFEYIDALRKSRAVMTDAHSEIMNVWLYETATAGAYPAERQPVSIQVNEFGGDGGGPAKISYALNFMGPSGAGTFNPSTATFTAVP